MGGGTGIENPSSLDSEEVIPKFKKKNREDPRNNKNVKDLSVDVARGRMDFFSWKKIRGHSCLLEK